MTKNSNQGGGGPALKAYRKCRAYLLEASEEAVVSCSSSCKEANVKATRFCQRTAKGHSLLVLKHDDPMLS